MNCAVTDFLEESEASGRSDAYREIRRQLDQLAEHLWLPETYQPQRGALAAVERTYHECCVPDWDGDGALAVSPATFEEAVHFVRSLPTRGRAPDVSAGRKGQIGFEWTQGHEAGLLVTTSGTGSLIYSALYRGELHKGSVPFQERFPASLLAHLQAVLAAP